MTTSSSAFSSNETAVLERTLESASLALPASSFDLETARVAAYIASTPYRRIALQFPDTLLSVASTAVSELKAALTVANKEAELFILGDTSFDGFQVDFVAAQHFSAEMIVHYGPVDLAAEGPLPVCFVLGRRPLDVAQVAAACATTLSGGEPTAALPSRLLVVPSLPYAHLAEELAQALEASCPHALVCRADLQRAAAVEPASRSDEAPASAGVAADEELARGRLLGRRLPVELDQEALRGEVTDLLYIGGEDASLSNLVLLLSHARVHLYEPPLPSDTPGADAAGGGAASIRRLELPTAKRLMRRYYLVHAAKEAEVVGILVGTLSAAGRKPMLAAIKALCKREGRKCYTFVMGKLNAAKLANFMEVGVYVLLGSCEHALLDSKDFYRPVVTPYELHLALTPGAEWTGEYILDYGRLLPQLRPEGWEEGEEEEEAAARGNKAAKGAANADGEDDGNDDDDDDDDEPHFSLLSGRLLSRKATVADEREVGDAVPAADAAGGTLVASAAGVLARRGDFALARSGAETLARRSYQGLDPRVGQHQPARVVEGLTGIASDFTASGEGAARELKEEPMVFLKGGEEQAAADPSSSGGAASVS